MKKRSRTRITTTYNKVLLLSFVMLLAIFGTSISVHASETDASYTITAIESSNGMDLDNLAPFELVRRSSQNTEPLITYIDNNGLFNLTVTATIKDREGNETSDDLTLRVSWTCWDDSTTVTDTTICGDYIEIGTIQLPDNSYAWLDGVSSVLRLPVRVYDPAEPVEIVVLEDVWNEFSTAFSIEQNSRIEEFLQNNSNNLSLQTAWPCYDAEGNEYLCPVVYHTDTVRTDTVGIYDMTVTLEAPLNCHFSDSLTVPSYSIPVSVQSPGQPRLDLSYISANYEFILFPWITSGIDLGSIEVWMSEDNGEWKILESDEEEVSIYSTMLGIYTWYLNEGSSYQIQVKYEGGQTGIASFTYEWDTLSHKEYIEGDRDGGDTDGNPPDDSDENESTGDRPSHDSDKNESSDNHTQNDSKEDKTSSADTNPLAGMPTESIVNIPAQAPDTAKSPEALSNTPESLPADNDNEPANEASAPTIAPSDRETPFLFGSEIALMLENLGTARFSAERIMLNIPAEAIASLHISDTDHFLVTILPLENNGFSIDVSVNDHAVTTLSDMQISLPYQPAENATPVLMNEAGTKVADGDYNPDTGLTSFIINKTGLFYIQDVEIPLQDTFVGNTLTVTELSKPDKAHDNSAFKLIATVTIAMICSASITIAIYIKKRRK